MRFLLPSRAGAPPMALKFLLDIGGLLQMGMTALWLEVLGK